MADELTITLSVSYSKNGAVVQKRYSDAVDVTLTPFVNAVETIDGATNLDIGEVVLDGYILFHNLDQVVDSTNFITISNPDGDVLKLKKGEMALLRLLSASWTTTITATNDGDPVDLEYFVLSD